MINHSSAFASSSVRGLRDLLRGGVRAPTQWHPPAHPPVRPPAQPPARPQLAHPPAA